uniref:Uncharacterized protein n=1 Tax=Arion vulgaris TaxID=1028688 RepID=A0A0B7A861_9EUPU
MPNCYIAQKTSTTVWTGKLTIQRFEPCIFDVSVTRKRNTGGLNSIFSLSEMCSSSSDVDSASIGHQRTCYLV